MGTAAFGMCIETVKQLEVSMLRFGTAKTHVVFIPGFRLWYQKRFQNVR